ncbi:MAG: hypothetical protein H2050_15820 [Sphingobium sp.]|uniref:hypothetical protein n=1 Tax=Sphingobium sp. TaxID=1912891 RepID=UPI00184D1622|nr:hypothetical protein [Sphingobium sp.]MBA4756294.1 hypothetical protein [Sphingobium sp.]
MTAPRVAIRLGTEGKDDVKRDAREVGDAWEASANRAVRAYDKAATDLESAERRRAAAAQKIAAIMPQTAMQMRINDAVGTGSSLQEGSARASAAAFRELFAEQERLTAGAAALRAQLDPTWAAQQRFNNEMVEARALIAAGAITLDEYCAKLRMEEAALESASASQSRHVVTSGAMRAGMQQLGFQAQDFAVQVIGGTDAIRAFAMQAPQAIGALQLMSGQAEGGSSKFAKFASILGGPVGVAIGVAIPLAVMLGEKFFSIGDDADNAANKVDRLGDALKRLRQEQASQGDIGEVLTKVNALRDQRMVLTVPRARGESPESYTRRLAEARGKLDSQIADLEQQIAWNEVAQQGKRDASAYKATPAAKTTRAVRESGKKEAIPKSILDVEAIWKSNTAWGAGQETGIAARDALTQAGQALMDQKRTVQSINDEISAGTALLNVEWVTRGKSRQEIERAIELKRFEISLQERGIDLTSQEGKNAMSRRAEQISFNQLIGASVDKMEALRDIGASAVSKLLDPTGWTSWKSLVLGAINDVTQAFWKLAIINPIQNQISGGNLPTIGSLFGLFGGGRAKNGGSAIGNMFTPAGAMLVGENGPEIVNMPRGAQVMTASDTRRAMAGNDNGLQIRVIKGDLFDVEVTQISAGVSAQTVGAAAPIIASGASNGAQQAVSRRNSRRLA